MVAFSLSLGRYYETQHSIFWDDSKHQSNEEIHDANDSSDVYRYLQEAGKSYLKHRQRGSNFSSVASL